MDLGSDVAIDASGNCYVVGVFERLATFGNGDNETTLNSIGIGNIFIAKYGSNGELIWVKKTGVNSSAEAFSEIAVDASGAIYITSPFFDSVTLGAGEANETTLTSDGTEDILIAKYTAECMLLWAKQAGGVDRNRGTELAVDASGHSYISGFFTGSATFGHDETNETMLTAAGASDVFVAKYGIDGSLIWARRDGGAGSDSGRGIAVDPSGNSHVMGSFQDGAVFGSGETNETAISTAENDIFLAKYDTEGILLWVTQSNGSPYGSRVALDAVGNSFVAGSFEGSATFGPGEVNETTLTAAGVSDIFIAKYDISGGLVWAKRAGGSQYDMGSGLAVDATGNSHITGPFEGTALFGIGETNQTTLASMDNSDIFVASYNSDGTLLTATRAGGTRYDAGGAIAVGPSGDIFVTGRFNESATFGDAEPSETTLNSRGTIDIFIARYAAVFPTHAAQPSIQINEFELGQNYPNPFNPQTTIQYGLLHTTAVRLVVYDLKGSPVKVLVEGLRLPGRHTVVFDAGNLSSGVYLYRLETDSFRRTGRMLLLK